MVAHKGQRVDNRPVRVTGIGRDGFDEQRGSPTGVARFNDRRAGMHPCVDVYRLFQQACALFNAQRHRAPQQHLYFCVLRHRSHAAHLRHRRGPVLATHAAPHGPRSLQGALDLAPAADGFGGAVHRDRGAHHGGTPCVHAALVLHHLHPVGLRGGDTAARLGLGAAVLPQGVACRGLSDELVCLWRGRVCRRALSPHRGRHRRVRAFAALERGAFPRGMSQAKSRRVPLDPIRPGTPDGALLRGRKHIVGCAYSHVHLHRPARPGRELHAGTLPHGGPRLEPRGLPLALPAGHRALCGNARPGREQGHQVGRRAHHLPHEHVRAGVPHAAHAHRQ